LENEDSSTQSLYCSTRVCGVDNLLRMRTQTLWLFRVLRDPPYMLRSVYGLRRSCRNADTLRDVRD
jgi:hypothetical protein